MKRFGFLRHYKKIRIEGINISSIVNKCISNGVALRKLKWEDPLESTVEVQEEDYGRLKKLAGHSYKMTILREGGAIPLFRSMKANILTVLGAFLLGALIFYQGTFIAEIQIDGYQSLTETEIRKTLTEAGLYEGAKKQDDYSHVKKALYASHEKITWVSIFQEGRLVRVNIAEAGKGQQQQVEEDTPVNIIASRSGMIEKIIPLQGNAKAQKGDYVNKGDVLISGRYKYQSSDYSKGDGFFTLYSHAKGQAYAKVPRQLTYYLEKKERTKAPTGKSIAGIRIQCGDAELDTAKLLCSYGASVRSEKTIFDAVTPLPISVSFVKIKEVTLKETPRDRKKTEEIIDAALRQYQREHMKNGEEILNQSIDYSESENVIKVDVLLEVLEDIGVEKTIKVKKTEKNKEELASN